MYSNSSDMSSKTQEDIQFILNNVTAENLTSKFAELKGYIDVNNQQWFASHLVEARAKMQPNYHDLYMNLIKLFENKKMWAAVLRETYISTFRSLNSESTLHSATERQLLKNLGIWLGRLTLARDKPIKYNNIAFKQLLIEAYDTQRLLVVIPFVCKVLSQGKLSKVFKPPNPWITDIVRLLVELYHHAELKLNQKFEIEVLCSDLELDLKGIEPSNELMNRVAAIEEATDVMAPEVMDRFDNLSLNGMGAVASGRFSPQEITSSIPDLGPLLIYPPGNDMVNQARLQEIVRTAITRAVHEIISPVVERSVTIAAISTAQMIHKDFATEPNETRVRSAAINMVKKTAGSLALVTSKEPLRASMTNYIRQMSHDLPQGLPEGTIIMCVNSNLDLACSQVEKKAEERAVPEIEEMIEPELEARRHHRMTRPDEPYYDPGLNRWSWTIPHPFKLQPSMNGLNSEQMSIYEEFARQPRQTQSSMGGTSHVASASDATRSMANEILGDQYPAVPNLPTPAETPAMPLQNQQYSYAPTNSNPVNGRNDPRQVVNQVQKCLVELQRVAAETPEKTFKELSAPHRVMDVTDFLTQAIIKGSQDHDPYDLYIIDTICATLFAGIDDDLTIDSLVHVLQTVHGITNRIGHRVSMVILQDPEKLLSLPVAVSLVGAEMVDWQRIDDAASNAMAARKEGSLEFFSSLLDAVLLNDRPTAYFADFNRSLEVAWQWMEEDPSSEVSQQLREKFTNTGRASQLDRNGDDQLLARQSQMNYLFKEWVHLYNNPNASSKALSQFILQLYAKQVINNKDDLCIFLRGAIDFCVDGFELQTRNGSDLTEAYIPIDALARLIVMLVKVQPREGEVKNDKAAFLQLITALVVLVLNHHHVMRVEAFNQRVFFRLFSTILAEMSVSGDDLTSLERQNIILGFAGQMLDMRPSYFPGFLFGWMALIAHRDFLPQLLALPDHAGWEPLLNILECLLAYVSDLLKSAHITPVAKDIYRGTVKLLVVLQHDFPDFVAAHHTSLASSIPIHCVQLHNLILNANPTSTKNSDPLQPGLKVDRIDEIRESPENLNDVEAPLRQSGLLEILDQALQTGPSEAIVAHIAHAIQQKPQRQSGFAFVPINANVKLIESLLVYVGMHSIARASQNGSPTFSPSSPDADLISMLVHELRPEARYYLINSIANQLRFPNTHTHYFSQALLEVFGSDLHDPEESEIRQQITRVLLERSIGQWPQPWGLLVTIQELVKNEKFMFFELPFIKASPDVADRFAALASRPF